MRKQLPYIDEQGGVKKQALLAAVRSSLTHLMEEADYLLHTERYRNFWQGLQAYIVTESTGDEKRDLLLVYNQLTNQDVFLNSWIETALQSEERFELFIRTKAAEIHSGDDEHDYFWALTIRHDQLVALVTVEEAVVQLMKELIEQPYEQVVNDPRWQGIIEFPIEKQIFLEAENVHQEREKNTNR